MHADDAPSAVSTAVVDTVSAWVGEMRGRAERFDDWRRRLTAELAKLPDTLQRIREGSTNLQLVSQRLAKSSEALEEVTSLYESTMSDTTRRTVEAAEALRSQIEALSTQAPDRMAATMTEVQRTFESLAELNPLWPTPPRRPRRDE